MAFTISVPDTLRQSVEAATGGRNTVLYDDKGYPSVMYVVPQFRLEDIAANLGAGVHPAFVVGGTVRQELLIGRYIATLHDSRALSLPGQAPAVVNFTEARAACAAKGAGWHLMTNAEWAAVALWCWKNGFMPRGNTNYGRAAGALHETGRSVDGQLPGLPRSNGATLTGSGPASWTHDGTSAGISDLAGNVAEWVGGLRLNAGEIQIIKDNDAADSAVDHSEASAAWRAIAAADGALVAPGTAGTLKYDATAANGTGAPQLDDVIDNQSDGAGVATALMEAVAADAGINVPNIMRQLALFPHDAALGGDRLNVNNQGERIGLRGGSFIGGTGAGVFSLHLTLPRTVRDPELGCRPAFVL